MTKQIDELAEQGRKARQARIEDKRRREASKAAAKKTAEERWQARIAALETYAAQRSLTPFAILTFMGPHSSRGRLALAIAALLLCLAIGLAELLGLIPTAPLMGSGLVLLAFLAPGLVGGLATARATSQDKKWRASLPFKVEGYELALSVTRSYPSDRLTIEFESSEPAQQLLRDLCELVKAPTKVKREDERLMIEVNSNKGSKFDGHRSWFPRWFRDLNAKVLLPLHQDYPIHSVTFPD